MGDASKPLLAGDRVKVYLTLVPYLLERGQVSLAEAAAEFGVSTEQMRTMVEKLTVIGLPGDNGFWQPPQEMFDIDWDLLDEQDTIEITNHVALRRVPRFTAREAAALLAGLQLVAALPSVSDTGLVADLIAKLSRGAASAPADVVIAPSTVDEVRRVVSDGLREGVAVSFGYQAPDAEPTVRTVDPAQVLITDGQWYLQGWCHLRQATRTFHLDRVSDPVLTDIPISHHRRPDASPFAPGDSAVPVQVRIPEGLAPLLGGLISPASTQVTGGILEAELRLADPRAIKRIAGRLGGRLEVRGPSVARTATHDWAAAGLALYAQPAPGSGL